MVVRPCKVPADPGRPDDDAVLRCSAGTSQSGASASAAPSTLSDRRRAYARSAAAPARTWGLLVPRPPAEEGDGAAGLGLGLLRVPHE